VHEAEAFESPAIFESMRVDSWNNIEKYANESDLFFLFDEQRVIGSGLWAKKFISITKKNKWILLSATPGDTWMDYVPVFIANGFYRNRSEFIRQHVVYSSWSKFPKIERYLETAKLMRLRDLILVPMPVKRHTVAIEKTITVPFDLEKYMVAWRDRWDPFKNEPIAEIAGTIMVCRRIVNSDERRLDACGDLMKERKKTIVFYNFDFELVLLRDLADRLEIPYAEWNGHKHQLIPGGDIWTYLVQYTAGAEGWNCIETDTIVFYSTNYSYRIMEQASGRIDRLNTPFTDLYYFHLTSRADIDKAIMHAVKEKRIFNENKFLGLTK